MIKLLIVLAYLFGFLGAISALLLTGIRFTQGQRIKYPILKKLDGKQLHLAIATCFFLGIAYGANAWKDSLSLKSTLLEFIERPNGGISQKATSTGIKRELEETASEKVSEAENYFNAGEHDFATMHYKDAASNYKKSTNILPTMSAYMNLGVSLWYISDFQEAYEALISGLQLARKKGHKIFEAGFLIDIGNVYGDQAKLNEALNSYEAADDIYKQIGNPLGHASALGSIGIVYQHQGNIEKGLKTLELALKICKRNGWLQCQADTFGSMGNCYLDQWKLDEALNSYSSALKTHKEIGDPLGQASDLNNIGIVYYRQGNLEEAIKFHKTALESFRQIGYLPGQADALTNLAQVYLDQGKLGESLKYNQEALEINKQIGNPRSQAINLHNIGNIFFFQGKSEEALNYHHTALETFKCKHGLCLF